MTSPALVDPARRFPGRLLLVVPHMDDEALACGGLIAKLPDKDRLHLIYATDGMKSPAPIVPGRDSITADLGEIRMEESRAAMASLGVPEQNLCFLRLPEGQLAQHQPALAASLHQHLRAIQPDYTFIPFRYDRHPDHLVINHVVTEGRDRGWPVGQVLEYFVYHRWRLLPARDIRKYIRPQLLLQVDTRDVARQKRRALSLYQSQTTLYFPWQTRPILRPVLLDEESNTPEFFLLSQPAIRGAAVFTRAVLWIRLAHRLEPVLQRWKYLVTARLTRARRKPDPPKLRSTH